MQGKELTNNVILKHKIKKMVKGWLKKVRNSKQRFYILKEWSKTQKDYVDSLQLMQNIQQAITQQNVLSEYETAGVFFNLDAMVKLAKEMLSIIDHLLQNWHPRNTILSQPLNGLSKFFIIYKQYCANYERAQKTIGKVLQKQQFKEIIKNNLPMGFNIYDYLIKPVNRPTKYKLLLSTYLGRLGKDHKDRQSLQATIQTYHKIVIGINEDKNREQRSRKAIELQKKYGNIIKSSRALKEQFICYEVYNEYKVRVYVFSDLLLIVKLLENNKDDREIIRIQLDENSYCIKKENTQQFNHMIFICGVSQNMHLTFVNSDELENAYKILSELKDSIYNREEAKKQVLSLKYQSLQRNRNSLNIKYQWIQQQVFRLHLKTTVVGAQVRKYDQVQIAYFIVKFQINKPYQIYQLALYDLNTLKEIEKYYRRLYPHMKIPSLNSKLKGYSSDDLHKNFKRFAEYRYIHIQSFLNFMLRQPQIAQRPQYLAYRLKIHQSIWQFLTKKTTNCMCQSCSRMQIFESVKTYQKQYNNIQKRQSPFCIIKSFHIQNMVAEQFAKSGTSKLNLQRKVLWANSKMKRIDYFLQNPKKFGQLFSINITIPWISGQVQVNIPFITKNDTVRSTINIIAQRQGFKGSRDLCLIAYFFDKEYILDDDEYIWNIVKFMRQDVKEEGGSRQKSWFQKILQWDWGHNFKQKQKTKLRLRKLICFDKQTQRRACEDNKERYALVIGELLAKYKKNEIVLNLEEIKYFCALYYGIQFFNKIGKNREIQIGEEDLKKYLPDLKLSVVNAGFIEDVKNILFNTIMHYEKVVNVYKHLLNQFGDKIGWITIFLRAQNTNPQSLSGNHKNVLVGVNFRSVLVCVRSTSNAIMLQFPIKQCKYQIIGNSLQLKQNERSYQFISNSLYIFDKLVNTYKLIAQNS